MQGLETHKLKTFMEITEKNRPARQKEGGPVS